MRPADQFELLSAIAVLDRAGRKLGYRPLDPHDGEKRATKPQYTVRLKGKVSLGFATGDVYSTEEQPETGEAYALSTQAFALAGGMGPLPLPIAEALLAQAGRGDQAGLDFLDLFHGRLLRLFYLIRKRSRPALGAATGNQTAQARMVRNLAHLPDTQWLRHAGLQSGIPQSAASLTRILSERLQTPVRVVGLQGSWQPIGGAGSAALSRQIRLGSSATLGGRYWNPVGGLRVVTPTLPAHEVTHWLPKGQRYVMLSHLLSTVLQKTMTLTLSIRADGHSLGRSVLGQGSGLRLGQNTWIKSSERTTRLPEVRLSLSGVAHGG
jgi:type VI secretion system protein ImpH